MKTTNMWALRGLVLALALALAFAPSLSAQTAGSNLAGRVQDSDGGPLPGVTVTATNSETGLDRSTTSGPDGTFLLPSLPAMPSP